MNNEFDVLVIGAGINGLATAYHLSLHKKLKVGVLEQFSVGNTFGSSHGSSRIIRSTYANPSYIKMMHRVRYQEWPEFEKEMGCKLIYPNPGCFFGPGSNFEKYIQAIASCGFDIEVLEASAARRIFPQFRFQNVKSVLRDHTAGVIAAREALENLKRAIVKNGVKLMEGTKAVSIDTSSDPIQITTSNGALLTKRLVITAGPWVKQLIPQLNLPVTPIRQTAGYFKLQGSQKDYQIGRFPNWAYVGDDANNFFYGLPEFEGEGIKIAQHITTGKGDDPDIKSSAGDPAHIRVLEKFIEQQFVQPIDQLVRTETCFYTNTPNEDFILDLLPNDKRIVIGSACSGHAFKFAPLTGRILSELILHEKTTIPEFEEAKKLFSLVQSRSK